MSQGCKTNGTCSLRIGSNAILLLEDLCSYLTQNNIIPNKLKVQINEKFELNPRLSNNEFKKKLSIYKNCSAHSVLEITKIPILIGNLFFSRKPV